MSELTTTEIDSTEETPKSVDMNEEPTDVVNATVEEVSSQAKDPPTKKPFSTLKEENDKLRTYLGLVKMCNNSAINKIRSAITETIDAIHGANETPIDANVILKQLEVIQNEIMNMQSMHTQLEEGIEAFQMMDNNMTALRHREDTLDFRRDSIVLLTTTGHEVPRKSTGLRRTSTNRGLNKMKAKNIKDMAIGTKLLNRVVDKQLLKGITFEDNSQTTEVSEEREAVSNIDMSSAEDRENVSQEVREQSKSQISQPYVITRPSVTKKPYISEEFKSSHLQRLEEAKRRREEMNRQLEREGKRRPKAKKSEDIIITQMTEMGKKSPKKKAIKKKTIGKVVKKKSQTQPVVTTQSYVVPLTQSALESLSGQTIQIIASGGTQILCRNDGNTFTAIPATTQWQTTGGTQWTTATASDANNLSQSQWSQYQS